MSKEAMKLALEALEYIYEGANNQGPHTGISWRCVSNKAEPVISALREALAEPQEKYIYGTPLLDAMTGKANEALDKKAENARELGLDYEPAQQEPFGYFKAEPFGWTDCAESDEGAVALYERPQPAQRHWVGLTNNELQPIADEYRILFGSWVEDFARAIEAKLRSKNEDRN